MKSDMTLLSRLLDDVLPEGAYFILLVGEMQTVPDEENCGFATDLAPQDAIAMMEEMLKTMKVKSKDL